MNTNKVLVLGLILVVVFVSGCTQLSGTPPEVKMDQLNVYGRLLEYTKDNDIASLRIQQEITNCELNKSIVVIQADTSRFQDNLSEDNEYFFRFYKADEPVWQLIQVSDTLDVEYCSRNHEYDLLLHFVQNTIGSGQCPEAAPGCAGTVQLIPLVLTEGDSANV